MEQFSNLLFKGYQITILICSQTCFINNIENHALLLTLFILYNDFVNVDFIISNCNTFFPYTTPSKNIFRSK